MIRGRGDAPWVLILLAAVAYGAAFALWMDLPSRWAAEIPHGRNEDWDWQLTFYEVCRVTLLRFGQAPLWNPYTQGGVPMLANPESPFLYPGFLLVLALGTGPGLRLWVWAHMVLGAAGAAGLARASGVRPWVSLLAPVPWLMAAFVPGFIAYGHIMFLAVAWLPWLLLALPLRPGPTRRAALAALALAMTLLMGGHYVFLYGALLVGLAALWRLPVGMGTRAVVVGWLALDVVLAGQRGPAWKWGLVAGGAVTLGAALAAERVKPRWLARRALDVIGTAASVVAPAVLLVAVKLLPGQVLLGRAERLTDVPTARAQDAFDAARLWEVWLGAVPRPSGHEGHEVYGSAWPLALALVGAVAGGRPGLGFAGGALLFLGLSLADNLPVDYASVLHSLPGFSLFRVTERYALVYSMFVGLGAAAGVEAVLRLVARIRLPLGLGAAVATGLLAWGSFRYVDTVWTAHGPDARLGVRSSPPETPPWSPFAQVEGEESNFDSVRRNRGRLDCWTTAWLADGAPGLEAEGAPGYRGEVYAEGPARVREVRLAPGRVGAAVEVDGPAELRVNQNHFPGWRARVPGGAPLTVAERDGIVAVELPPGSYDVDLRYAPPGLLPGASGSLAGLALVGWALRRRDR
ncbi:hypothetical protein L6R50_14940 [Myxococcota bacterium]|nr:hypothetical protein [Myxococcota bacterium]